MIPNLLADAAAGAAMGEIMTPLLQMGGLGVVLAWFMWRMEPRMRSMEAAIDRMSKLGFLELAANPATPANIAAAANAQIEEIKTAEVRRGATQ